MISIFDSSKENKERICASKEEERFKGVRLTLVDMNPVDRDICGAYNRGKILDRKIRAKIFLARSAVIYLVRKCF